MRRMQQSRDGGFTLIELAVSMALMGILAAIAVGPWRNYQRRQDHVATTRQVVGMLRNAQVSAVAENQTYRVDFVGREVRVNRYDGSAYTLVRSYVPSQAAIAFASPSFTSTLGSGSSVYFLPRGSASTGSVGVTLDGKSKVYLIEVEGLTARVSYR